MSFEFTEKQVLEFDCVLEAAGIEIDWLELGPTREMYKEVFIEMLRSLSKDQAEEYLDLV